MITEIEIIAGEILNLLEERKMPVSIPEIKFFLDEPVDLIDMGIGWLMRENCVGVVSENEKQLFLHEKSILSPNELQPAASLV